MGKSNNFQTRTTPDIKRKLEALKGDRSYHELMEFFLASLEMKTLKGAQRAEIQILKWLYLSPKNDNSKITQTRIFNITGGTVNLNTIKKTLELYKSEVEAFNSSIDSLKK